MPKLGQETDETLFTQVAPKGSLARKRMVWLEMAMFPAGSLYIDLYGLMGLNSSLNRVSKICYRAQHIGTTLERLKFIYSNFILFVNFICKEKLSQTIFTRACFVC